MSDYDPNNPQHPLDKWFERNRHWLRWLILPAMLGFGVFYYNTLLITFDQMNRAFWLLGNLCFAVCMIGVAYLVDIWSKSD